MKPWRINLPLCFILCFLAGCGANRDLIVLLPDPDGKVGVIQVTTEGGSQILDKPGYATQVKDVNKPPVAPKPMDKNGITDVFGAALAAQPDLSVRFISFVVYFEFGATELTNKSKKLLPEIVTTIKSRKSNEIYVIGHTDRVGTQSHNMKLSARRAYWIRDFLISNGAKSNSFVVSFHGETSPLIHTEDEVAEPLNRRVEVLVR